MSALPFHDKILSTAALLQRYRPPRTASLVFTNGCFDLLHSGHVEYLFAARALGAALVVGLNTDASVRRIKGEGRPINAQADRAIVLAGLACVDAVTFFDQDTPLELISQLLPDILVKGGDYQTAQIVGAKEVEAVGGQVVVLPYIEGRSTTQMLERMLSKRDA